MRGDAEQRARVLRPYLPRLAIEWLAQSPDQTWREIDGTVAFVDISGFTKLSERLSRLGKVGAEELTDAIGACFTELLAVAYAEGGGLIKFGGDALLLLFRDGEHASTAARAAVGMRAALRRIGQITTPAGRVRLRMSVGIHTGRFHFFFVGDEHRELIVTGPAATQTTLMEQIAEAGEIVVSPATAAALPPKVVGASKGAGFLLRAAPPGESLAATAIDVVAGGEGIDVAVPAAIREHLLAGGCEPEHRQTTVAFMRFEDADRAVENEGPSGLADRLATLIGSVQKSAASHDVSFLGTDIDRDGGKIILAAGAPRATGADEEAVLLTVREILDGGPPLPLRIGVNRGHVFAGDIGPPYRRTYTVMGDTVNLAARLMAAAQPGQVLATVDVLERSRSRFATRALEPFQVKGKAKPVQAVDVGAVVRSGTVRSAETFPLAGREKELELLLGYLEEARARRGRAVELAGDPGMGTSRLAGEVRARAGDALVLTASGGPYAASTPYFPFRAMLREFLGVRPNVPARRIEERLRARVESNAPDLVPWLPMLGVVLDVRLRKTPQTEALDEEFRRAQLQRVVVDFLTLALPTETVFVFEDVHYFDEASAQLVGALASAAAELPWLIIATRREGEGASVMAEAAHATTLRLGPLPHETMRLLAEAATEDDPLPEHQINTIVERSDGNPLFLHELLALTRGSGSVDDLPASVEALMAARIDRLLPTERAVLRSAAVLGTVFDVELLAAVLEADDVRAEMRRLTEFVAPDRHGRYRFTNILIREAAYEGLTYRKRQALHARVGETILARSISVEEQSELLALHFFHAGRWEETWSFARLAGRRAQTKYANVEAARFLEQALEAARRLHGVAPEELTNLMEDLGDVRRLAGDFRKADESYRAARRLTTDPVAAARLLVKQVRIADRLGRFAEALRWITRGRRLLDGVQSEDAARQRAQLSAWYAAMRQAQGHHEDAIRWCRRAIGEAEASGNLDALAHAYVILDWAYVTLGRSGHELCSPQALDIYEELGDVTRQALVLNNLGAFAYFEGRWNDAVELYERGRLARERTGDPVNAALGISNIGEILSDQGRLEEAEPLTRHALRVWKAAGDRSYVAYGLSQLGRVAARARRFEEALSLYEEARAGQSDVGDQVGVIETDARIAECLIFRGDGAEALELIGDAMSRDESMGGVSVQMPLLHRLRGYALLQLGGTAEARAALDESLRAARARKASYEEALTLRALAQIALMEGSVDHAASIRSAELLSGLGVVSVTDPAGIPPLEAAAELVSG